MPNYTFHCKNCGQFTLSFKSTSGNKTQAVCPICQLDAKRVYFPPNLFSYSKELRSRIEKGMEPKRVKKEELGTKQIKKSANIQRPWQV
ncbi:zinc ribbon domain-containing protein [Heyndrickxia oleronia]|uniref:zinc ribbon domain-containing protein n=1 Tax=Heyndrickxia TaxID=2837504 RepID=UPI0009031D9C|nr:zinc ribbon domain-containing protein [Heyndrickxia oleronia]MCM3456871.1 zinc ribbon domain-containing protein [Heyndrickxia oleronia]OJH19322.1 hypothetical protein BLX88_09045 [Bacillus obstructivus]